MLFKRMTKVGVVSVVPASVSSRSRTIARWIGIQKYFNLLLNNKLTFYYDFSIKIKLSSF